MKPENIEVAEECAEGSLKGVLTFPEVLKKLSEAGVERYHADYSRQEITYYWADGTSHVVSSPHAQHNTAVNFSAMAVADAVKQSQSGEHTYVDFVRKTMEAGCVGYFVQITGGQVIYFGRNGDSHTEHFPALVVA
jgi:uncharacterized protein YbcV (DUF1398 family)